MSDKARLLYDFLRLFIPTKYNLEPETNKLLSLIPGTVTYWLII